MRILPGRRRGRRRTFQSHSGTLETYVKKAHWKNGCTLEGKVKKGTPEGNLRKWRLRGVLQGGVRRMGHSASSKDGFRKNPRTQLLAKTAQEYL